MRGRMRRSLTSLAIGAMLSLSVLVTPTLGANTLPSNIDVYHCMLTGGQSWPLQAGAIDATEFWGTKTRGQAVQWRNSSKLTVAFDGVAVANPERYFQEPYQDDAGWVEPWAYPTGITLKAGETITMYFRHELTSTVYDGYATYPAGVIWETTCTGKARG